MSITETTDPAVQVWGAGGAAYDAISFGLSDAIGWAVQSLWPMPGEHVLDIGCGTGWGARLAAGAGARVTGVDITPAMLDAARSLSAHLPQIDFREGAAEALPFDDHSFDGAISSYGIIFTAAPDRAIAELARVLRPDGRAVLVTWADRPGYTADFFGLIGRYSDAPPPGASPMAWGDPDWLNRKLSPYFKVGIEPVLTYAQAPDADALWHKYVTGFGPIRLTYEALSGDRRAAMRRDWDALYTDCSGPAGLRVPRHALLVHLRRK